ncbi:hypothetical protein [Sorangium sp. So ce176]|uniref:hypothetical protein n=1 Tax=Sorangium sp. So ce176 TaxID=3133286 RepID=UPI003F5DE3AB
MAVVHHADADDDGTSSAALVGLAFRALGGEAAPETPGKGGRPCRERVRIQGEAARDAVA